jgi:drug/metabolite transporter (DMT)-like permease
MATPAIAGQAGVGRTAVILQIAAVTLFWGLNWPVMKYALTELTPFFFRALVVMGAGLTLIGVGYLSGQKVAMPRRMLPSLALVSLFAITGWHMLTAYGLLFVGGGRAAIVAYTMPIWAAILSAIFLRERLTGRRLASLLLGSAAMGLLLLSDLGRLGESPLGTLLILLAALSWAAGIVGTKRFDWGVGAVPLAGWQLLVGGVPILLLWPIVEGAPDLSGVPAMAWIAVAYATFVGTVFAFATHVRLIRLLPATIAAIAMLAIPIVGVVSSALLLDEVIGTREIVALVLVLAAMSLVLLPSRPGVAR